jgi:CheY-like chemotaxis protein
MSTDRRAQVLLVEDNPSDVRLTQEAMKEGGVATDLHVVGDGDEALRFLLQEGEHENSPRPDLILLDLNLPKKSGREVLEVIKSARALRSIPVVVLSTSGANEDVCSTYDLHANCYITKPSDLDEFIRVVQQIESFWLSLVRLPDEEACA